MISRKMLSSRRQAGKQGAAFRVGERESERACRSVVHDISPSVVAPPEPAQGNAPGGAI